MSNDARPGAPDAGAVVARLLLATPCFGNTVWQGYLSSALETARVLTEQGIPHGWIWAPGDSLVQRARNNLVAEFMAIPDASHLLFIDADIEWKPEAVVRLLAHDRDMICGAYPKKVMPPVFAMNPRLDEQGRAERDPKTGAVRISDAATGFLMIKRTVIQRMMDAYPELRYEAFPSDRISDGARAYTFALFDCMIRDRQFYSEDYGFCRRWEDLGGEVWVDPEIELVHHGAHAYRLDPKLMFRPVQ